MIFPGKGKLGRPKGWVTSGFWPLFYNFIIKKKSTLLFCGKDHYSSQFPFSSSISLTNSSKSQFHPFLWLCRLQIHSQHPSEWGHSISGTWLKVMLPMEQPPFLRPSFLLWGRRPWVNDRATRQKEHWRQRCHTGPTKSGWASVAIYVAGKSPNFLDFCYTSQICILI